MKHFRYLITLAIFLTCQLTYSQTEKVLCTITTELGKITVELCPDKAPLTVKNFLYYVDNGLYNGSSFFRVCTPDNEADREIQIEVIQGGNVPDEKCIAPIPLEKTTKTGLKHTDGAISMARDAADTATCSFFFCIGDQPELDFGGKRNPDGQGFAAFGKVIDGMDVVRKIQQQKDEGQMLIKPVKIVEAKRIK